MSGERAFRCETCRDGARGVIPRNVNAPRRELAEIRRSRLGAKISTTKDSACSGVMTFAKRVYTQYRHALTENCLTSIFQAIHEEPAISLCLTRSSTISRVLRARPLTHNPVLHRNASYQVYNPLYPEVNENTARTRMAIRLPCEYKSDDRPKG